jgi:protein involved in polysaccharide export with SLBB domain
MCNIERIRRAALAKQAGFLLLGAGMLVSACAFKSPPGRATGDMSTFQLDREPYRIRTGDMLDVRFYKTPELNVDRVPVRKDGRISLDLIGDVQAAGMEPDELAGNLSRAYARELQDPRISVIVREFGGQIFVGGEVGSPQALKYADGMTALQAIQAAGGFKDESSRQNVVLLRQKTDHYDGYRLYLERALTGEDYGQNVALQPNDVVFVPRSRISNLNLIVAQYLNKNLPTIPILPIY